MSGLFLGPVTFEQFEVPGRIVFGGRQRAAIHNLPGGGRVIDAMGRDDAPLVWSGTFSGPSAASRALQLDLMRAQGLAWPLAWDVFAYSVVVSEFSASYERANWIPYRIVCSVVVDETATLPLAALSLVQSVQADLGVATSLAGVDLSAAGAALSGPGALVAGSSGHAAATASLQLASAGIATQLAMNGSVLGGDADFAGIAAAAQQSAQLAAAQGFVRRAQSNLASIGS